jgi:PhnB protein
MKISPYISFNGNCADAVAATAAFNALKDGGEVCMELQETFWSKCFGSLTDKFGVNWNISIGCPQ